MRRKYFGLALAAITTLGPMGVGQSSGWAGDREIAEQIIQKLQTGRDSGELKDFAIKMKVDAGVVTFNGSVAKADQKRLVLGTVAGIEGIENVVDEVEVTTSAPAKIVKPAAKVASNDSFNLREALAKEAEAINAKADPPTTATVPAVDNKADAEIKLPALEVMPGEIIRTAADEPAADNNDQQVTDAVIAALGDAQRSGKLKGFGVDVTTADGMVEIVGKARTAAQRKMIVDIASTAPGVAGVRESIDLIEATVRPVSNLQSMQVQEPAPMAPPVQAAPMMAAGYRMNPGGVPAQQASNMMGAPMGAPVMGQPVPMGGYQGAAGPSMDQPYLPNYAWPGYAAYPNYAAVTYPQQYSPSAFPYIGPFYPYPQVPLGWRKVTLEWDDGWWNLDFTSR